MKRFSILLAISLVGFAGLVKTQSQPNKIIGEKVMFAQNPLIQKNGFSRCSFSKFSKGDIPKGCKYDDLAGKTATITNVDDYTEYSMPKWCITLQLDDNKKPVYFLTDGILTWLGDAGFLSDLKLAKTWVGGTYYNRIKGPKAKGQRFNRIYKMHPLDDLIWKEKGEKEAEAVSLRNVQKVKLIDVPGWYYGTILFVFQLEDSTLVYWVGYASELNNPDVDDFPYFQFDRSWWKSDPLIDHPEWSEDYKQAIRKEAVKLGMTDEMVKISWGEPLKINRTVTAAGVSEQWIYGEFKPYVYFEDGKVTAWQE